MALSPQALAAFLTPEQLELLAEFADDFDDDTDDDADATADIIADQFESRSTAAVHRVRVAKFHASASDAARHQSLPAKPRSKKATRKPQPLSGSDIIAAAQKIQQAQQPGVSKLEAEWAEELDTEVEEDEKHDHRMPAVLRRTEVRELLEASKTHERNHLIIRTFYATGVRRSELADVRLADLYLDEQKILIRRGKGDKDRYVMIDRETARMLDDFVYGRALDDNLFGVEDQTLNRVVKRYANELGITQRYEAMERRFSAHALRHTYATHLWESGLDAFVLRDLLGHRYLGTTRRYVAVAHGRISADYNAHHPLAQPDFWQTDDE